MAKSPIQNEFKDLDLQDFSGGYITEIPDYAIPDNALSGGQDVMIAGKALEKREGHTLYGNYMGPTTGVLGLIVHEPQGGTDEFLSVYDTSVMRYVGGTWTALTSVTMTTNLRADSAYFPLTSKTYIVNGTDQVVKYTSGTSGDQSDANFKKGKYIVHFKNRLLVANVASQRDYIWYTDLGVDTFGTNNYLRCEGEITGMIVFFDKWLTFTKRKIYRTQNFTFSGSAAGPESFIPLPTEFGAIYDRTIQKVGNLVYFLGQSSEGTAAVYVTDGYTTNIISDAISPDLDGLAAASLTNACAVPWGRYYRFSVTPSGGSYNTREFLFDTVAKRWLPPFTNDKIGGFSCYATVETSGKLDAYAGTQVGGQVYKLNQADYDEAPDELFTTVGAVDTPVDGNPAKRAAQSFQLSDYTNQQSVYVNQVALRLKKNAGTTTELTVRIETDNAGVPSGTLADASATTTISAITSTSYDYAKANFSTPFELTGDTTYWIVVKHTTEGSGNSQYYWSGHATGTYGNGNAATYGSTTSNTEYFRSDADPESTTVDGSLTESVPIGGVSFSDIRSGTGSTPIARPSASSVTVALYSDSTTDQYTDISRFACLFDTSGIPDDASITSATLSLYITAKNNDFAQSISVTSATTNSNTNLTLLDVPVTNFGSTKYVDAVSIDSLSVNAYNALTLNASGLAAISLTGITKFAVRLTCDIDNSAPTWSSLDSSYIQFRAAEYGIDYAPYLTVSYTTVTGSSVWVAVAARDQNFVLYDQADIDGYGDTKAFYLAPQGQVAHIREAVVTTEATGDYDLQVGINTGSYGSFDYRDMPLSENSPLIGSTFTIGSSTIGAALRSEYRIVYSGTRARSARWRFRNRFANQPFKVYGIRTRHEILNKIS